MSCLIIQPIIITIEEWQLKQKKEGNFIKFQTHIKLDVDSPLLEFVDNTDLVLHELLDDMPTFPSSIELFLHCTLVEHERIQHLHTCHIEYRLRTEIFNTINLRILLQDYYIKLVPFVRH